MSNGQSPRGRYGWFRWGGAEGAVSGEGVPEPRSPERVTHPTDEEALGAGLALNPAHRDGYDWDLQVDSTGALISTRGMDEYAKDVAFATARQSGQLRGELLTANALEDLKLTLRQILEADPRTKSLRRLDLQRSDRDADTLVVEASLIAEDDEYHDAIFPVRNTPNS